MPADPAGVPALPIPDYWREYLTRPDISEAERRDRLWGLALIDTLTVDEINRVTTRFIELREALAREKEGGT
jgi:hypothetical protein